MNDIYLTLGCFGRQEEDFINCTSIENSILTINNTINDYQAVMDYLDSCGLFDKPIFDHNSVKHFIYNMQNKFNYVGRPLWLPTKFTTYEKFVHEHKMCGVYIKLCMSKKNIQVEEKSIFIPGKQELQDPKIKKLRLIGGRR